MTGDSAVTGIREIDKSGTIAVFSEEDNPPYNRPPLSKALWKGDPLDSIWRKNDKKNRDLFLSVRVTSINPSQKTITTSQGKVYHYERLLLATGGKPRTLSFDSEQVIYFRTLQDYRKLRGLSGSASSEGVHPNSFVVIGGGFIGSEIAAALAINGKKVNLIFPDAGLGANIYPRDLSSFLKSYYMENGVNVISGESVVSIDNEGKTLLAKSNKGREISVDAVVAGIGVVPNDDLARSTGIDTDNGILVDDFLRTTNHDIYAAGDVANFYSTALEKRTRVEHDDNANTMGRIAGRNMAGAGEPYHHLPFFYSDLFELGYEAVGELDSRLETFEDWTEEFRKGVIYYGRDGIVKGVLLWNTWGRVDAARELIYSRKKFEPASLKGLIKD